MRLASAEFRVAVEGSFRSLHPEAALEVYRIASEAIRNSFRHANASQIEADITYAKNLQVRIRDNGKGIDPVILNDGRPGHYGIAGLRERAMRLGGKLVISSAPGAGTVVELCVPGAIDFEIPAAASGAGSSAGKTKVRKLIPRVFHEQSPLSLQRKKVPAGYAE